MTDLMIRVEPAAATAVLTLHGELDLITTTPLRSVVESCRAAGHVDLAFDLSDVTSIDSNGMDALVWTAERLEAFGGKLTISAASHRARDSINLAGLDTLLDLRA